MADDPQALPSSTPPSNPGNPEPEATVLGPGVHLLDVDLTGAHFERVMLAKAVLRGVDVAGAEIDSPWLLEEGGTLVVNGVDVTPYVDEELNRRFPGRNLRRATTPEDFVAAWAAVEGAWATTTDRVAGLPPETVDVSVQGEWSFAQTLRHLVMATDVWLRRAIQDLPEPYHPIGQPHAEYALDGYDPSAFSRTTPTYSEVMTVRAERQSMVRDFIAATTPQQLEEPRPNPWAPNHVETVRSCLRTILEEEWEHHRYAVRDLAVLAAQ